MPKRYKATKEQIMKISLFLIMIVIVLPITILTFYSVIGADDFSNMLGVLHAEGDSWLEKAINRTKEMYYNWGGGFAGIFAELFELKIYQKFGFHGLHIELFFISILFFGSFFTSFLCFWRYLIENSDSRTDIFGLLIFDLILFGFLNNTYIADAFYWCTGSGGYTVSLLLFFLSFILLMFYIRYSNKLYLIILSCIFCFLSCGGSINISALICAAYLGMILFAFIHMSPIKGLAIVFFSGFSGTLINVLAPGNYLRHNSYNGNYKIIKILFYTLKNTFKIFGDQVAEGTLLVVFIVALLFMNHVVKRIKIKFNHPLLVCFYCLFSLFIVNFPVCFGYASDEFNGRSEFVAKLAVYLFCPVMIIYAAGYLCERYELSFNKNLKTIMILCCMIAAFNWGYPNSWIEQKPLKLYFDLAYGKASCFYDTSMKILNTLENDSSSDVYIVVKEYDHFDTMRGVGLTPDPDYWANKSIAKYYHKNSAQLHKDSNLIE